MVRTSGSRMTPNQCCTAGEESRSIPVSQVSHPRPRMYEYASCRDEWWCSCQCPASCHGCHSSVSAEVGCTGHSRPYDRTQKAHKLIPKVVAITFPVDGPVRNFRALRDWRCFYCRGSQPWGNSPHGGNKRVPGGMEDFGKISIEHKCNSHSIMN